MSRYAFFRQTGWLMIATVAGGVLSWLVHPFLQKPMDQIIAVVQGVVKVIPALGFVEHGATAIGRFIQAPISKADYGLFNALVALVTMLNFPAIGLQPKLTQQTAAATDEQKQRQLRGAAWWLLRAAVVVWLIVVLGVLLMRNQLMASYRMTNAGPLFVGLLIGLPLLWQPVLLGIMQGRQNFMWMGWQMILNAMTRCLAILILVRALGLGISAAIAAVLLGWIVTLLISAWQTWPILNGPREPFQWKVWFPGVIPLTLGLAAVSWMLNADLVFAPKIFGEESGYYAAAAIIGRAIVFLTGPMTQVMFPKIVHAAAREERTGVMFQALGATALLGGAAAAFCTILPWLPLKIVYDDSYLQVKSLVGLYAWCVLPLTLSTVLVNNLLAHQHYKCVPALVTVALLYAGTMWLAGDSLGRMPPLDGFRRLVSIMATYSMLMFLTSAYYTIKRQ
jgi:O-antigen/teichoic acid export membrane protein